MCVAIIMVIPAFLIGFCFAYAGRDNYPDLMEVLTIYGFMSWVGCMIITGLLVAIHWALFQGLQL